MNDTTSQQDSTARDDLAQLGDLLSNGFRQGSSELPSEIIDALEAAGEGLPDFTTLMSYEQRLWIAFSDYDPPSGNYKRGLAIIALGWLTTTFHHTHAAFQLAANGLGEVAVANVRAALEHALYLSAFADEGDSEVILESIAFRHVREFKRALDFLNEHELSGSQILMQGLASIIDTQPIKNPTVPWPTIVKQVCDRLNSGSELYLQYRALSERIHPGVVTTFSTTVFDHLSSVDPRESDIDDTYPIVTFARHPFWLAIGACVWAGWAADQIFATHHFGPLLAELSDNLGFMPIHKETRPGDDET